MRHVVDTSMVAHLWANKSQPDARNKQGNFYFDGDTIYSYGGHFPIARHTQTSNGKHAILFTTETYSNTTAKHIGEVRSAIRGEATVFRVADVMAESKPHHIANHQDMIRKAKKAADAAKQSRVYGDLHYSDAIGLLADASMYSRAFALGQYPIAIESLVSADELATIRAKSARGREKREALQAQSRARWEAAEAARRLPLADRIQLWREGASVGNTHDFPETFLRIRGKTIETSRGASFPSDHARLAFRVIASCRANERPWERNGKTIHLGGFHVDSIDTEGNVKAGCHTVNWGEIERIARELEICVDVEANTEELVNA